MSINHYVVLPILALLLQPVATDKPASAPTSNIESAMPEAGRTDVYFHVTVGNAIYFSHTASLPYTDEELTYEDAGKRALSAASQRFANQVAGRFDVQVYVSAVYAIRQQGHQTREQFEAARLTDIQKQRQVYQNATYIL